MVIKRVKGDTYPINIKITDSDDNDINLSGATVFFTVKRNLEDTDAQALISVDVTSHTNPTEGETSIPMVSPVDTDIVGEFYYDVKVKLSTGIIESVFTDKIIFTKHTTIRTS